MRRLGEGGPGTKPNEYYAFRAVPRMSEAKSGVQSFGRVEKKSWYTGFHKKQLRVAPLRRSKETRSKATKFRIAELVAPGFVMVQKPVNGAGAKCKNHDNLSRSIGKLINYTGRVSFSYLLILYGTPVAIVD